MGPTVGPGADTTTVRVRRVKTKKLSSNASAEHKPVRGKARENGEKRTRDRVFVGNRHRRRYVGRGSHTAAERARPWPTFVGRYGRTVARNRSLPPAHGP